MMPKKVELVIPQPKMVEMYYKGNDTIDHLNRQRQDDLKIERKVRTKLWWKRVNTSIWGMIVGDSMNVHQGCAPQHKVDRDPDFWLSGLTHEMIDNNLDFTSTRSRSSTSPTGEDSRGDNYSATLTPSKKWTANGWIRQGRCRENYCLQKSTLTCRACSEQLKQPFFLCNTRSGRNCFALHCNEFH